MSLRVWLPLDGDLHNQGASEANPILMGTGITWTAGKIGQAATFPNNCNSCIHMPGLRLQTGSVAAWILVKGTGGAARQCIISEGRDSYNDGVEIWAAQAGTTISFKAHEKVLSATIALNTWYHIVGTFGNGEVKLYLNGQAQGTPQTYTADMTYQYASDLTLGKMSYSYTSTGNYFPFNGQLNDVRIYDHALSAAEVREISQGLVLHYKLDDTYAETTTNLYSGTFSNTCYNGATNKYSYGTTTDMYKTTGNFQGKESVKVYMGTAGLSAYPYVYFDAFNTTGTAVHTLSFDYYPTSQTSIIPYSYNGSYNISYITSNGAHDSKTNISSITIPVVINQWNHIAITMQKYDTTNTSRGNGYIRIGSASHTSTTSDYWLFANIQVEAKDHETGYIAPGTTRSNVQIQDSSGYGNNGIINSNPIISLETARYNYSISFDGVDDCIKIPFNDIIKDKNYTVSVWTYKTSIGTKNYQTILGGPSGFELEARSSSSTSPLYRIHNWGGGTTAYEFNKWNLFTFVHTDSNSKLYVNGELKITGTSANIPTGNYYIGAWNSVTGQNYEGLMSDFRIYCTALDADAIRQLYEVGAKVDNKNNVHSFELNENNQNEITKTGILKCSTFSEFNGMSFLKYDPNVYIEPDGSCWVRVFHHNNPGAGSFSSSNDFAHSVYIDENRWFNVELANHLDKWEIMIKGKFTATSDEWKLRWIQQYNPMTATYANVAVANVTKITASGYSSSPASWGGLYLKNGSTYLCANNGTNGNWWGAVGSYSVYQGGIPGWGPNGTITTTGFNDVYLRIDNVTFTTPTAKNTKNKIWTGSEFIEL